MRIWETPLAQKYQAERKLHRFDLDFDFNKIKLWIFDLDGVVYRGPEPIPSFFSLLRFLQARDQTIVYYSNNSTRTPAAFCQKIQAMGGDLKEEDVYTSSIIASMGLKKLYPDSSKSAYVIGESGLLSAMKDAGFDLLNETLPDIALDQRIDPSIKVDVVIVGLDSYFTYGKLRLAHEMIARGAAFYASNTDSTLPHGDTSWPGAGTMIAALSTAVGHAPLQVFGKPNAVGIELILEKYGMNRENAVMIGDRLETDILVGTNAGIATIMVGTGASSLEQAQTLKPRKQPSIYVETLELLEALILLEKK